MTEIAKRPLGTVTIQDELTVSELLAQMEKIQQVMAAAMKEGTHYGTIPGTDKPTLYKPGAEKLCLLFRLDPEYDSETLWDGPHMTVKTTCRLFHSPSGTRVASGEGMCSTKETKYGVRVSKRTCPVCGVEAIIKGKAEYGGGWICFKKQGGCGAKFADGEVAIEGQQVGKVENPELADTYNTVLKMANKRALVAAVLNGTAASDIFTQDMEDLARQAVAKVTPELLSSLRSAIGELANYAPELWAENVVVANAARRFNQRFASLADLSEEQALTIISGAMDWALKNPAPEGEVLEEQDEIPFGEAVEVDPQELDEVLREEQEKTFVESEQASE